MGKFKITKDTANIHCRVKIGDNPEADGTIIRQKSSRRFIVTDGKNKGNCTVSDLDENKLTANTMTLTVERQDGTLQRVEFLSNKFATDFNKNRFIITGAKTDVHENATVLTDEAKAKLSEPTKKKAVVKKAPAKKKAVVKKPVAKKAVVKKPVEKPVAKKAKEVVKKEAPKIKETTVKTTEKNNEWGNDTLFDFSITED